ncbi:MAG: type II toxin-antitoxin system RelE/ParE family toxin [Salinivirgaceae bacterium]|nr:type II toxin-antitoxin system RelE/ParE family toxin [Salinivirgaceae bacterium]
MINFIRKYFNKTSDISQESTRYSRLSPYLENQCSALQAAGLLTDEEFRSLNSSLPEISTETINTFAWSNQLQRFLKEYWNPELKIQREKEEDRETKEVDSGIMFSIAEPNWYIGITSDFTKSIGKIDKKIQGRILEAIAKITADPITPNGNTIKPLSGEKSGMWRYRIGDFRIIYHPDKTSKHILLLAFSPRGSAYD